MRTESLLKGSQLKEESIWSAIAIFSGGDVFYSLVTADHHDGILAQSQSDQRSVSFRQVGPNQVAVAQFLQQHPELWIAAYQGKPAWTFVQKIKEKKLSKIFIAQIVQVENNE